MSAGSKLAANPGLLARGEYSIEGHAAFQDKLIASSTGLSNVLIMPPDLSQCAVDIVTRTKGSKFISLSANSNKAYRYLPYRDNMASVLRMSSDTDQNARLVLTGPLSGCSVFVAVKGETAAMLHVNSNENARNEKSDPNAHMSLAIRALAAVGMSSRNIVGGAVQDAAPLFAGYTAYGDRQSMVLACRPRGPGSAWTGYVYGWGYGGTLFTQIF